MMLAYNVDLTPDDNGSFLVTSPKLPELTTFGENEGDAIAHATQAVEEALAGRIARSEDIPESDSFRLGSPMIRLRLLAELKVQLYMALRSAAITRAELARRMGVHREQVDRLFRLDHASRTDQLEDAFKAVGREVRADVRDAPPSEAYVRG